MEIPSPPDNNKPLLRSGFQHVEFVIGREGNVLGNTALLAFVTQNSDLPFQMNMIDGIGDVQLNADVVLDVDTTGVQIKFHQAALAEVISFEKLHDPSVEDSVPAHKSFRQRSCL